MIEECPDTKTESPRPIGHIYISCPISVPESVLQHYILIAQRAAPLHCITWWQRGTKYDTEEYKRIISTCDAFAVILPDNAFQMNLSNIPSGTYSEIAFASGVRKDIFIGYTSKEGVRIYAAQVTKHNTIEGIPGTSRNLAIKVGAETDYNRFTTNSLCKTGKSLGLIKTILESNSDKQDIRLLLRRKKN